MKKLIILALLAMIMAGCKEVKQQPPISRRIYNDYIVVDLDSCEYIKWRDNYGFQHKGNCKYCAARRKAELKELVKQLKEM